MIGKLKTKIIGSVGMFNKSEAIILACKVCNAQTEKINELINKVNELETKLDNQQIKRI